MFCDLYERGVIGKKTLYVMLREIELKKKSMAENKEYLPFAKRIALFKQRGAPRKMFSDMMGKEIMVIIKEGQREEAEKIGLSVYSVDFLCKIYEIALNGMEENVDNYINTLTEAIDVFDGQLVK